MFSNSKSYSAALLSATYKNGMPGKRTDAHEKAEFHRFKTEHLFNGPIIPKTLYAARLIQYLVILKAIETRLQNLSGEEKSSINAFFTLSYLEHLWRTPAIQNDLKQLRGQIDDIHESEIAATTKTYLTKINGLTPKALLAHFLVHVAGFMHGGNVIRSKYIKPSNDRTEHKISTEQYDFSSAAAALPAKAGSASLNVYADMMATADAISLSDEEYQDALDQGNTVYETMVGIYDDLCTMHTQQPKLTCSSLAVMSVALVILAVVLNSMSNLLNTTQDNYLTRGPV